MSVLRHKAILGIGAVLDIAIHSKNGPVAAKQLAKRLKLPPRHLESLLQAFVHQEILNGVRGPRGGYTLRNTSTPITLGEVARVALSLSRGEAPVYSEMMERIVLPTISGLSDDFLKNLDSKTIQSVVELAESGRELSPAMET